MNTKTSKFSLIPIFAVLVITGLSIKFTHASNSFTQTEGNLEYEDSFASNEELDDALAEQLKSAGFTGKIQSKLVKRLGRPINATLADLGRLLWFDSITSLGNDNSCSGCHSPLAGFGDTQSIAIGVENNSIVGPERAGPRNQRRTPQAINSAFFPSLMWNARFSAISHNPFDVSEGVRVPFFLGGTTVWKPGAPGIHGTFFDPNITKTLLGVQANFPPTELIEVAGHAVVDPENLDPRLYFPPHRTSSGLISDTVPEAIAGPNGSPTDSIDRSYSIRSKVLDRINATPEYVEMFSAIYPEATGGNITFAQIGAAIAEFEFTLTFADAPLDRFARGDLEALTLSQKRGAVLFFGKANCIACHSVAGESNEMFSDFQPHVAAIPQVAPASFGLKPGGNPQNPEDFPGNFEFSGPNHDEDFGREELTGDPLDRYAFRTAPLRNIALQPAFFHNGSFTRLKDALRYHLNTQKLAYRYDPEAAGLAKDLTIRTGPIEPLLKRLDSRIAALGKLDLNKQEFDDLYKFVQGGLLDKRALPINLNRLIPKHLPSGRKVLIFQPVK
ncbi:MAG: cytochrome c peroxidase [Methylobacter sp.]|nr:cytochrome c peroxidase [Methylobacter sp.]